MRTMAIAATLLSFALVGSASAQQVVATNPVTGAATGAAAGAAQGAAAAGPVGALAGAPLGLAAGAVAGTLGAIGTVAGGLVGAPTFGALRWAMSITTARLATRLLRHRTPSARRSRV